MPSIRQDLMAEMSDPAMRHCMTCGCFALDINEPPCRECLHADPRNRPRWTPKGEGGAPGPRPDPPGVLPGQLSLF